MIKVQIAVSGQYAENYGYDKEGNMTQNPIWKQKGAHTEIVVKDVPLNELEAAKAKVRETLDSHSYSNPASRWDVDTIMVLPNDLSRNELIEWEYEAYRDITSVSQDDIKAFLNAVGR